MRPSTSQHLTVRWNKYPSKSVPRKKNSKDDARIERIRQKVDLVRDMQDLGAVISDVWDDL